MTRSVGLYEAKTHLSELVAAVERGEEIVITRHGRPVAKLAAAPPEPRREPRRLGVWKGLVELKPGWDDPLPDDIIAMMYGEHEESLDPVVDAPPAG